METEELVKYSLGILEQHRAIDIIVDIGTGSGVIPLAIAYKRPHELRVIATDMSQDALDLAQENLALLKNSLQTPPIFLQ